MSPRIALPESKEKKRNAWPPIRKRTGWNGKIAYLVDLGKVDGKRVRYSFSTKDEAETCASQERIKRRNEGLAAFSLPANIRAEAAKCQEKLSSHGVTLTQATNYYLEHVIAFREAPIISEIIKRMISEAKSSKRRERTVQDLENRLAKFSRSFGKRQLASIAIAELEEWLNDPLLAARSRINYATKVSQLYNFAIRHQWAEVNIADRIPRPDTEDKEPEIFTVKQAQSLLEHAHKFGLLPYVALGLFAGLRSAELLRLNWESVKLSERSIIVGAEVAKKRSRRVIEINDVLALWLAPYCHLKGNVVPSEGFRDQFDAFREKLKILKAPSEKIENWPQNGLRHSFGSYHLSMYGDAIKTAGLMGHRSVEVVHNHYKALVLKSEAANYWNLKPDGKAARIILMRQSA